MGLELTDLGHGGVHLQLGDVAGTESGELVFEFVDLGFLGFQAFLQSVKLGFEEGELMGVVTRGGLAMGYSA